MHGVVVEVSEPDGSVTALLESKDMNNGTMEESLNATLAPVPRWSINSTFFSRGCFPMGQGWIWRTEPYNETYVFGNVTVEGSIYMCRNTRCNLAHKTQLTGFLAGLWAVFWLLKARE